MGRRFSADKLPPLRPVKDQWLVVEDDPPPLAPVESAPPVKRQLEPLHFKAPVESARAVESKEVKGWFPMPNQLVDVILPTLKASEQAVLLRLYRLAWGHHTNRCHVGLKTLANRCNLSVSQTRFAVRNVEARGYIKTIGVDLRSTERGTTYEVLISPATTETKAATESKAPVESTPNKKDLKYKTKKGEVACRLCNDTGWCYPEGVAKGVKRCEHE